MILVKRIHREISEVLQCAKVRLLKPTGQKALDH